MQEMQEMRFDPWRRKCQPMPVFLPGKFHGQGSLAGYSLWGGKELDTTEQLTTQHTHTHTHTHTQLSKERCGVWGFRAGDDSWGDSRGGEMLVRQKCPMCRQAAQVKKLPLWCSPLGSWPFSNLIYFIYFPYKGEFLLCRQSFSCVCTFLKVASLKSLCV